MTPPCLGRRWASGFRRAAVAQHDIDIDMGLLHHCFWDEIGDSRLGVAPASLGWTGWGGMEQAFALVSTWTWPYGKGNKRRPCTPYSARWDGQRVLALSCSRLNRRVQTLPSDCLWRAFFWWDSWLPFAPSLYSSWEVLLVP